VARTLIQNCQAKMWTTLTIQLKNHLTEALNISTACCGRGGMCLICVAEGDCYSELTLQQGNAQRTTRCIVETVVDVFIAVVARSLVKIDINSTVLHKCTKQSRDRKLFTKLAQMPASDQPVTQTHANASNYDAPPQHNVQSVTCWQRPVAE